MNAPLHPNAQRLESLAAGDHDAGAEAHLTTCAACADYVTRLRRELPAFTETDVQALLAPRPRRSSLRPMRRVTYLLAPALAAAAAVLLMLRFASGPASSPPVAVDAPEDHATTGGIRFKGPGAVAVIRERAGHQERLAHEVTVRAGDRLRLEVSTAAEGPLTAGVLADDGTWVALLDPALLPAGTHISDHAVRFDDQPTAGVLLVGHPDAIAQARQSRRFDEVTVIRIHYEQGP